MCSCWIFELYNARIYKDGHDYRFLISFAGKYLPHDYCIVSPLGGSEGESLALEHQFYKINVPHIEANLFGPAFIEVSILKICNQKSVYILVEVIALLAWSCDGLSL